MRFLAETERVVPEGREAIDALLALASEREHRSLTEHETYELLAAAGLAVPAWVFHPIDVDVDALDGVLPHAGPFVAKMVVAGQTHKTELGGIALNVTADNAGDIIERFRAQAAGKVELLGVLFVDQVAHARELGGEMLIGLYQDPFFGPCVALGFGGTGTEYYKSIMRPHEAQVFIPADIDLDSVRHILSRLPVVEMLEGRVRGASQQLSFDALLTAVRLFQTLARWYAPENPEAACVIEELEVNPAIAHEGRVIALDGVCIVGEADAGSVRRHKPLGKIAHLLAPKSIAIAGVSAKNRMSPAGIILKKCLKQGIASEQIVLIHPKEREIEGIACVPNMEAMLAARNGEPVDCLVVGVPAKVAGSLIAESFERYAAHSLQVISAGFGETEAGRSMQQELSTRLQALDATPERRPVVNGPNTLGNTYRGFDTLFTPRYKSSGTGAGRTNAALICQSGAFMITRISDLADRVAPAIAVSVGNQMDLSVTDFYEHLLEEEGISTYGLYIEGLCAGDGIRLMRLVHEARERGKFTVIYRAGRTEAGMEAARGHTAAMAGDYDMFAHLMYRSCAMVADTFERFDDLMMLATFCDQLPELMQVPEGRIGVAALSNAGFEKCAMADHLMERDSLAFELAPFTPETVERLRAIYAEYGIGAILDIGEVLDLSPMMSDAGYEQVIRTVLDDTHVHFGVFSIVPETGMLNTCEPGDRHREDLMRDGSILDRLARIRREVHKPFVVSIESGSLYDRFAHELLAAGIPAFRSADTAARAVATCLDAIRPDVLAGR